MNAEMLRAVLFDLDDTLFDHRHSRRCGLEAIRSAYPELASVPVEALEIEHERLLRADYIKTLDGAVTVEDAMVERMRSLCLGHGLSLGPSEAVFITGRYRDAYEGNRRPVPGVKKLLQRLKDRHVKVGIISNGLPEAQREKLSACGLGGFFDLVVVSEEVGVRKPDKKIFTESLRTIGASPQEAVYIGDSWDTDIAGAHACGMKAIWLNRYGLSCPDKGMAAELCSYEPVDNTIRTILDLIKK